MTTVTTVTKFADGAPPSIRQDASASTISGSPEHAGWGSLHRRGGCGSGRYVGTKMAEGMALKEGLKKVQPVRR